MKIKEVQDRTGLTAKAIRMYEEKKLFSVERDANDYRNYSEENINRLLEIRLFRKLDIPVSEIQKFYCEELSLTQLLEQKMQEYQQSKEQLESQHEYCQMLIKDYDSEHREQVVKEYLDSMEYEESGEYKKTIELVEEINHTPIIQQICMTLIFLAPIISFYKKIFSQQYEGIKTTSVLAGISFVVLVLIWGNFIRQRRKNKNKNRRERPIFAALTIILCIVLAFLVAVFVEYVQKCLFVGNDIYSYGMSWSVVWGILFIEIEFLAFADYFFCAKLKVPFISNTFSEKNRNSLKRKKVKW